jgi:hypothetical protein
MMAAQRATVGLAKGSQGTLAGRTSSGGAKFVPPEKPLPTLADAGIDKHLATTARKLAARHTDGGIMSTATKGRRAEHRVRDILEAAGYRVIRAAGSKGIADLVAWNSAHLRLVSVKSGTAYASEVEREALRLVPAPPGTTREIWRLPDRKPPRIEVL